ncbi:MAG: hypothetical protein IT431_10070 [Phycisphaerales bacterium]|nr:hypothetical protein [Phycisphaerales bacterium]
MRERNRVSGWSRRLAVGAVVAGAGAAAAGGSGENVIIIADPLNAESMYAANYYRLARNVPDSNILYFSPGAANYQSFVGFNLAALRALIAQRGIGSQADCILLMPGAPFYISAPGLVTDSCSPVNRFSITGAYTTAFIADEVLAGVGSGLTNRYAFSTYDPARFDSEDAWLKGQPSADPSARRYYMSAMLGYTGELGNTLEEILTNVDRSAAADWTRPPGTFYFCQTDDQARSGPRHSTYPAVVAKLAALGAVGSHEMRELPRNEHDILSILTGRHTLDIAGAAMTILPGAYCDHLTSYAATFDTASQTKISEWIRKGATMSHGAVEEPCNYPGKFTHARSMTYYFQGASMGESVFRALAYVPFQGLIYGDPLCRPFDLPVTVTLADPPTNPVSGVIPFSPEGSTSKQFTFVFYFEVLVDNARVAADLTLPLQVDTTELADGWHDLRVLGYDTSYVESIGVWQSELVVDNLGRSASVAGADTTGDLATTFAFEVSAVGGGLGGNPVEIRLVQHGRVLDAAPGCEATLHAAGLQLGAGASSVHAEAIFADGMRVRSAPLQVIVDYTDGAPGGAAPAVSTSTVWAGDDAEVFVELPYRADDRADTPTFEVLDAPAQASIVAGPAGPYRLLNPDPDASGYDLMTYRVTNSAGQSDIGRVVIVYDRHPFDINGDGTLDIDDLYEIHAAPADLNFDGVADAADTRHLQRVLRCGELRDMGIR